MHIVDSVILYTFTTHQLRSANSSTTESERKRKVKVQNFIISIFLGKDSIFLLFMSFSKLFFLLNCVLLLRTSTLVITTVFVGLFEGRYGYGKNLLSEILNSPRVEVFFFRFGSVCDIFLFFTTEKRYLFRF